MVMLKGIPCSASVELSSRKEEILSNIRLDEFSIAESLSFFEEAAKIFADEKRSLGMVNVKEKSPPHKEINIIISSPTPSNQLANCISQGLDLRKATMIPRKYCQFISMNPNVPNGSMIESFLLWNVVTENDHHLMRKFHPWFG